MHPISRRKTLSVAALGLLALGAVGFVAVTAQAAEV